MKSNRKTRGILTSSSPIEESYTRIIDNSALMDDLQKNLEKQQQHCFTTSTQSKSISESLKKYSDCSSSHNSRIPLSDCMQRASEWQLTIGEMFNHLGNLLYDKTTQPLKETIRIQLEMVKEGKKKLKKSDTDQRSSKAIDISGAGNNGAAGVNKSTDTFDKLSKDTLQLFSDSELALENSSVQTVLSAYEAYYDFFQKGAYQMSKIKQDIDNYRKIILETNKVAAKLRNYIPRKTFGIKLEEVFARESNRQIPWFLEEIFKYLEKNAPNTEGIFRVSAGKSAVDALQQKIESLNVAPFDFNTVTDPHVVSSVLKSFFRSLPEPIIFYSNYQKYLPLSSQPNTTHITELKRLISSLPVCNQIILKNVLSLCSVIKQHKDVTKMDLNNLAVVLGPSIMESIPGLKAEDLQKPDTFAEYNALFILLVENYQFIFPSQSSIDFNANNRMRSQTEPNVNPNSPPPTSNSRNNITDGMSTPTKPLPLIPPTTTSTSSSTSPIVNKTQSPNELSLSTISMTIDSSSSTDNNNSQNNEHKSPPVAIATTPTSPSSSNLQSPNNNNASKKKSMAISSGDTLELLRPIDMQIHFINIQKNLDKLKTTVENTQSTEQGIHLIKAFQKVSEVSVAIQKVTKFTFNRVKPTVSNDDDKITKVKKTLIYTYENNVDLLADAKTRYESSDNDIEVSKQLEDVVENMDNLLIQELGNLDKVLSNINNVDTSNNNN